MIDITDTPHGLHLDTPGSPGLTLGSDETTAIVQHELGKLGLWWAKEQNALIQTTPDDDGDHVAASYTRLDEPAGQSLRRHGEVGVRHPTSAGVAQSGS